eukprot:403356180
MKPTTISTKKSSDKKLLHLMPRISQQSNGSSSLGPSQNISQNFKRGNRKQSPSTDGKSINVEIVDQTQMIIEGGGCTSDTAFMKAEGRNSLGPSQGDRSSIMLNDGYNYQKPLLEQMESEIIQLRCEIDMYKDKIKELERWLIMFLNNFYEGDPNSLKNIESGLMHIDELRQDKFSLQKALFLQRKHYMDLQNQYLEFRRITQTQEEESKRAGDIQSIMTQKNQLEQTLITLTEEVELLSSKNEKLLRDLCIKDFHQKYYESQLELEKLKQAHEALISTINVPSLFMSTSNTNITSNKNSQYQTSFNKSLTSKSSFICGLDKSSLLPSPRGTGNQQSGQHYSTVLDAKSAQLRQKEVNDIKIQLDGTSGTFDMTNPQQPRKSSLFQFLSCGGCSSNQGTAEFQHSKTQRYDDKSRSTMILGMEPFQKDQFANDLIMHSPNSRNPDYPSSSNYQNARLYNTSAIDAKKHHATSSVQSKQSNSGVLAGRSQAQFVKDMKQRMKNKDMPRQQYNYNL